MNYHINTILIWDSFKNKEGCPLCMIQSEIEKQLISRYLNEAVMVDACRAEVNKYGFCSCHFKMLHQGENKLGLALQTHTRYKNLQKIITITDNPKKAVSAAQEIEKELSQCLICRLTTFNISHYYTTIIRTYSQDPEFKNVFDGSGGFCLNHYKSLLLSVKRPYTESKKNFVKALTTLQQKTMEKIENDIRLFTEKFNCTTASKPGSFPVNALKNCINNFSGKIIGD